MLRSQKEMSVVTDRPQFLSRRTVFRSYNLFVSVTTDKVSGCEAFALVRSKSGYLRTAQ